MKYVIIGIHGLGNKPNRAILESWWLQSMAEGLKKHCTKRTIPKFEMVYWADILYDKPLDPLSKDKDSSSYIKEGYEKSPVNFKIEDYSIRRRIIDFLGRQANKIFMNKDLTLNYSFVTDIIISKYFMELEIYYKDELTEGEKNILAKDRIKERLVKVLEKYRNHEILLISHSMGSIIAFDVLTFLTPDIKIHTLVTMGSPLGLPVIVSKIAAEHKRRLSPVVKMVTPPSVYRNWFNFSDILDKIAFNYMLGDDFAANEQGVIPKDFVVVNDYQVNGKSNPHKSYGYLRTKEFAEVLNGFIDEANLKLSTKIYQTATLARRVIKVHISHQLQGIISLLKGLGRDKKGIR